MKVPEKIYIQPLLTEDGIYIRRRVRLQKEDDSIEYCRKDAFIEKACEGIKHLLSGYIIKNFNFGNSYEIDTLIEVFKKYMEKNKL